VPPDQGLATKQMSGKKGSKNRITLGFACNADGSEKLEIFFIRKSKQVALENKVLRIMVFITIIIRLPG